MGSVATITAQIENPFIIEEELLNYLYMTCKTESIAPFI
jgi:hypothetical protein